MPPAGMMAGVVPGPAVIRADKEPLPVTVFGRYVKVLLSSNEFLFVGRITCPIINPVRHPPRCALPHRQRLRHARVRQPRRRIVVGCGLTTDQDGAIGGRPLDHPARPSASFSCS
jgi:hypothetical protein